MKMESKNAMKLMVAGCILAPSLAMADSSALNALKATAGSDATAQVMVALPAVEPVQTEPAQTEPAQPVIMDRIMLKGGNRFQAAAQQAGTKDGLQVNVVGRGDLFGTPDGKVAYLVIGTRQQIDSWKAEITNISFLGPFWRGSVDSEMPMGNYPG
jgi:hypothetical protein